MAADRKDTILIGTPSSLRLKSRDVARLERLPHLSRRHDGPGVAEGEGQGRGDRMGLPDVVHVEFEQHVDALDRHAGALNDSLCRRAFLDELSLQRRFVERVEEPVEGLDLIVTQIGDYAAECGGEARIARGDRRLEADLLDQRARVQRAAAAERHQGKGLRIVAALDRDEPQRASHSRVGDPHDRRGRRVCVEPQRIADMREDGAPCGLDVEPCELAADRPLGIDAAEHDMSVGQGRPVAAGAVADRSGHGACALRARPAAARRDRQRR